MSKPFYVVSTLSQDTSYPIWSDGEVKTVKKHIVVKGGTGVANKNLITPLGVVTQITEDEAKHLADHRLFKLHQKNGFVRILDRKIDPEVAVTDGMNSRDNSAPLVPEDFAGDKAKLQVKTAD